MGAVGVAWFVVGYGAGTAQCSATKEADATSPTTQTANQWIKMKWKQTLVWLNGMEMSWFVSCPFIIDFTINNNGLWVINFHPSSNSFLQLNSISSLTLSFYSTTFFSSFSWSGWVGPRRGKRGERWLVFSCVAEHAPPINKVDWVASSSTKEKLNIAAQPPFLLHQLSLFFINQLTFVDWLKEKKKSWLRQLKRRKAGSASGRRQRQSIHN